MLGNQISEPRRPFCPKYAFDLFRVLPGGCNPPDVFRLKVAKVGQRVCELGPRAGVGNKSKVPLSFGPLDECANCLFFMDHGLRAVILNASSPASIFVTIFRL